MIRYALAFTLALVTTEASAGCLHHRCRARPVFRELRVGDVIQYTAPVSAPLPVAPASARAIPPVGYGDAYGFTVWLNGLRARSGLGAVGFDPNLAAWAGVNNGQQQDRGLGHHVMGPARRQNAGMGGFSAVTQMWMASPDHQAALLDPSIRWIGIAGHGAYWTFNAN